MHQKTLFASVKALGFVVMGLMGVAIVYASTISILYWGGIGV